MKMEDVSIEQKIKELEKPLIKSEMEDVSMEQKIEELDKPFINSEMEDVSIDQKIKELDKPILETVSKDQIENFKFFNERHYGDYYFTNCNKQGQYDDMCIRVHTNKLLLLSLAKGNDIVKSDQNITEIDFIINKGDRSRIKVQGKRKSGARQLHPETIVCKVKLEGEEEMRNIRAGITGYLIEINELVKQRPNLLKTVPKCDGFLAIVMPKGPLRETDMLVNNYHLINEEQYLELLEKRNT